MKLLFSEYCKEKCKISNDSIENNFCYINCYSILYNFFKKTKQGLNKNQVKIELLYKDDKL